jgi:hypothetical protein
VVRGRRRVGRAHVMILKRYIGDGVYAEWNGQVFIVTTSDGIGTTNRIVMEVEVVASLSDFFSYALKEHRLLMDRTDLPRDDGKMN